MFSKQQLDSYKLPPTKETFRQEVLSAQSAITCSKITIETLEQVVKYVQS